MRALALEHLHSNPISVYGDVLLERGLLTLPTVRHLWDQILQSGRALAMQGVAS